MPVMMRPKALNGQSRLFADNPKSVPRHVAIVGPSGARLQGTGCRLLSLPVLLQPVPISLSQLCVVNIQPGT